MRRSQNLTVTTARDLRAGDYLVSPKGVAPYSGRVAGVVTGHGYVEAHTDAGVYRFRPSRVVTRVRDARDGLVDQVSAEVYAAEVRARADVPAREVPWADIARARKVRRLVAFARTHHLTPDFLAALSAEQRAALAAMAGTREPSDTTWALVLDALSAEQVASGPRWG
ncbi:MAG: hypothetical protein ACOYY2_12850, partial [Actinomycetota bacterium]